jgi:hypothetical protein
LVAPNPSVDTFKGRQEYLSDGENRAIPQQTSLVQTLYSLRFAAASPSTIDGQV